ncbi:hypothetical protein TNCT_74091 [Trichonephila clavata]|uniref:Uncharacterized protein n=1 Tax=Trichonephila clavata TaxID=2740835 RepID=A0A8X6M0X5_TRICU|nr:hypothetical protein TNCT_74091 [Trichonephila clavata]
MKLQHTETLILGYNKFLQYQRNIKDISMEQMTLKNLKETNEPRELLMSELSNLPPCLDPDFLDHTTLKSKSNNKVNEIEKKASSKAQRQKSRLCLSGKTCMTYHPNSNT